jgi:hypothetical protein
MYILSLPNTTCFKAMMTMNLSELCSQSCFCESCVRMGDLLKNLVQKSQSGQYCVVGCGSLQA